MFLSINLVFDLRIFFITFPWLAMGIGIVFGGVPNVLYYLFPDSVIFNIWAWWAVHWLTVICLTAWMLWRGGAEMLVAHPGFLCGNPTRAKRLKFYWLLMLAGNVAVPVIVFSQNPTDIPDLQQFASTI